jgi:pimeloyl-ACP methyl ester carboxylesterase
MEQRRVEANGIDFAYLSEGPEDGPLVLCLHGFPDHAPSFTPMLRDLAAAGFHAVAPWMRGYHPTSLAPDGRYQSAVLALDALALMDALSPDGTADLVGHDWGSAAACGAAILAPERVRHLVSLALPHPAVVAALLTGDWEQRKRSWYMWFFQLDVLPGLIVPNDDFAFVDRLWSEWSPGCTPDPAQMASLKRTLAAPGVLEAALGYYRQTIDFARQAGDLASQQVDGLERHDQRAGAVRYGRRRRLLPSRRRRRQPGLLHHCGARRDPRRMRALPPCGGARAGQRAGAVRPAGGGNAVVAHSSAMMAWGGSPHLARVSVPD